MNHHETATFAAGCFWGVEADFRDIPGVLSARVGYIGGRTDNPTYRDVCSKATGHAEGVEVVFDPAVVSYDALLDEFWKLHDPTTLNRQGPDVGTQYRSAIFYHGDAQRAAAETSKARHQSVFTRPIVTEIVPAATFWPAEDYHQRYLEKQGLRTCRI
ncbi:MAG: peptide-methionine (S)-S-oxide reductase MsrA [Candidatus Velthaea sp.]